MDHNVMDELEQRLRAARPRQVQEVEDAFDPDLLEQVRALPIARRTVAPRVLAAPVAAGATLTAAAVLLLAGGPDGPPDAHALGQRALHWLTPPAGKVLHTRSVETRDGQVTAREYWQSADHPDQARMRVMGAQTYETQGASLYDPATNTIYDQAPGPKRVDHEQPKDVDAAQAKKRAAVAAEQANEVKPAPGKPATDELPLGDPIVAKVRTVLGRGNMTVGDLTTHEGVAAYPLTLMPGLDREPWTLWVSEDGRPLELLDPADGGQVIRWSTYEVLPAAENAALTTLGGAHPGATVDHDPTHGEAADARLIGGNG